MLNIVFMPAPIAGEDCGGLQKPATKRLSVSIAISAIPIEVDTVFASCSYGDKALAAISQLQVNYGHSSGTTEIIICRETNNKRLISRNTQNGVLRQRLVIRKTQYGVLRLWRHHTTCPANLRHHQRFSYLHYSCGKKISL